MIIQALGLFALFLAAPARADVSDSGNLTIGGQGVIQGTMTVQGSGFSVGGTTFSVAGGSVTLGGRLNAAAAGIKWADGTVTTSSSSIGGSGGAWTIVESTYPISATSLTFSVTPGTKSVYAIEFKLTVEDAPGRLYLRCNSDSGSNYRWAASLLAGGVYWEGVGSTTNEIYITSGGGNPSIGENVSGRIDLFSYNNAEKKALVLYDVVFLRSDNWSGRYAGTGNYVGSSNLSTITIYASAGKFSGMATLLKLNLP